MYDSSIFDFRNKIVVSPYLLGKNWIFDPTDDNTIIVSRELYDYIKEGKSPIMPLQWPDKPKKDVDITLEVIQDAS